MCDSKQALERVEVAYSILLNVVNDDEQHATDSESITMVRILLMGAIDLISNDGWNGPL